MVPSSAAPLRRGRAYPRILSGLSGDLARISDVSTGAWIAPRLHGEFGAVTLTAPGGYDAYARVCHPATDEEGAPASWAEVAGRTGRTVHAVMQWHRLVGSADSLNLTGSLWPGMPPERGRLAPSALQSLCDVLAGHTVDECHCFFALWEGWGWIHGGGVRFTLVRDGAGLPSPPAPIPPAFSPEELAGPRLRLPGRDYLMFSGPLSAVVQIGHTDDALGFEPQSPNLFWPADHAWCVASEIDFDSTLVAGTDGLIRAILKAPGLEAWRVEPDDSLAHDADMINA